MARLVRRSIHKGRRPFFFGLPRFFIDIKPLDFLAKGSGNVAQYTGAVMPDPLSERLVSLARLNKATLHDLWKQLCKTAPPCQLRMRKSLLVSILAYRIQEQAFGSLGCDSRRRLRQLARQFEADPNSQITSVSSIKPGTRLVRQWRGQIHVVNVERKGYEYKGSRYQSLSEIARLITGTRWSGPLFFGVKGRQANRSREAE